MKYCPICENDYPDEVTVCPLDGATVRRPGTRSDPFIGRVIRGRYRVERQLGEGGMGAVYLAEQLSIGRKVALKVLRGDFARDDGFVARFRQEAKLVAVLNDTHDPHVTLVHDFDQTEDGSLFIVMEWLEGRALNEVIQREGALRLPRAVRLATQIAQGLEAAHRAGVIHRDIKPHNIMVLDANDNIKLMDFGIARLRDSSQTPLTRVGTMMGTPAYMAPEQIDGQEVTDKTDIYSFGIVFYEMLTGVVPFRANTPAAVLTKQLREEPTPPTRLRPDVPPEIEELVLQALAKNPDHRPRDMAEIARSLSRISRDLTDNPARTSAPTARTLAGVDGRSPAETIAIPTPVPAAVSRPAPPSPVTGWPASGSAQAEQPSPTPRRPATETWVSDAPVSNTTVVLDQIDDTGRPRRSRGPVPSRSRRKLVLTGAVTAAVLVVGILTTWIYLASSPRPQPTATASVNPTVSGMSSAGGGGVSTQPASGTTLAEPEHPVGGSEVAPRPVAPRPAERVSPEVISPGSGSGVKPLKNETRPLPDPPTARPAPQRPARPVEGADRPTQEDTGGQAKRPAAQPQGGGAKSQPSIVASKPAPGLPSADLLRAQVEDRLRRQGLLRGSGPDPDTGVSVEINSERIVILRGILRNTEQRDEAVRLARVAGVAEVRPRINVQQSWN
jgi:serine/threonine protein kinase